jgi:hypothetical protein
MKIFIDVLKKYLDENPGGFEELSVLDVLYECYNEMHPYDNTQIKAGFEALYEAMNGMPLREMDQIIDPVCTLCREHERTGFSEGVRIGVQLVQELR